MKDSSIDDEENKEDATCTKLLDSASSSLLRLTPQAPLSIAS